MARRAQRSNVVPFKPKREKAKALPAKAALERLAKLAAKNSDDAIVADSVTDLAAMVSWDQRRMSSQLGKWKKAGKVATEKLAGKQFRFRVLPGALGKKLGPSKATTTPRGKRRPQKHHRLRAVEHHHFRAEETTSEHHQTTAEQHHPAVQPKDTKTSKSTTVSITYANQLRVHYPVEQTGMVMLPNITQTYSNTSKNRDAKPIRSAPEITPQNPIKHTPPAAPATTKGTRLMSWFTRPAVALEAPAKAPNPVPATNSGAVAAGPGFDAVDAFKKATWSEKLLVLIAAGLSGTAAYISVMGMTVLFPAGAMVIITLATLIEACKFVGFGVVSAGWRAYSFFSKTIVACLLLIAATINAMAVYGWLISSHAGPAAQRTAAFTTADAGQGADLEYAQGRVTDTDRRIATLDRVRRLTRDQKRERDALVAERDKARRQLADTRAGRSGLAANHQVDEATALPIRYATMLAEDVGLLKPGTDPETLMRWLAFAILLCGDPLALGVMWMLNSRHRRK